MKWQAQLGGLLCLQTKGFFDVKVDSQIERQPGRVDIVYEIDPGDRHRVEGVYFSGNQFFTDGQLRAQTQIKKGHFFLRGRFSSDLLAKSVAAMTTLYQNEGFSSVSIVPQVQDFDPQVDVTFRINEGPRDIISSLRVVNAQGQPIEPATVSHALNLGQGKPYSPRLLEQDRNQILASFLDRGYLNAHFESSVSPASGNTHSLDVIYKLDSGVETD